MITQNSEVYNPPTYLSSLYIHVAIYMEKDLCRGGCILHCFVVLLETHIGALVMPNMTEVTHGDVRFENTSSMCNYKWNDIIDDGATGKAGNGKRDGSGNGNDTNGLLYCLFHFASNHQTEASDSVVYRTGIFGPAGSR